MNTAVSALDDAVGQLSTLQKVLLKSKQAQVKSQDEKGLAKATALTWFNTHRNPVALAASEAELTTIDACYKLILTCSAKAASRGKYKVTMKTLRSALLALQSEVISAPPKPPTASTSDDPPSFAPLIADVTMQQILTGRWRECTVCVHSKAPLAAAVMMGGLLEALLLARINREPNKPIVFTALAAPRDKNGVVRPLKEWMLKSYIEVAHELKWISVSAKSVGEVLRDYRNFVHPYKQHSQNISLEPADGELLWEVSKMIARQILKS